jgi:hypothetical protein
MLGSKQLYSYSPVTSAIKFKTSPTSPPEPSIAPSDVSVDLNSITATEAVLSWTKVPEDADIIRGFFRGYRIQFAKADEWPENIREQVGDRD